MLQGRSLTNDQIFSAVDCAIQNNQVPYATNAVYLLLGASNIQASSGECHHQTVVQSCAAEHF